jgi:arsenate reductase
MKKVLVLCTGNSCRSQLAEGYLKFFAGDKAEVYSAGIETHGLNPRAVITMKEDGIDISKHTSNHIDQYNGVDFDFIITVCDHAKERCPVFPSAALKFHYNFPDPAKAKGTEEEILQEFRTVRQMIKEYCEQFVKNNLAEPRIMKLAEKKLVGKHLHMSLATNRTMELWQSFMPHRRNIKNSVGTDLFSLQVYDPSLDFRTFNLETPFEKWALTEVTSFENIPEGMEAFTLEAGLYAVFIHRGLDFQPTFQRIFYEWLPNSSYALDQRPHFELLGSKYKNGSADSEEEVWVPIKVRNRAESEETGLPSLQYGV